MPVELLYKNDVSDSTMDWESEARLKQGQGPSQLILSPPRLWGDVPAVPLPHLYSILGTLGGSGSWNDHRICPQLLMFRVGLLLAERAAGSWGFENWVWVWRRQKRLPVPISYQGRLWRLQLLVGRLGLGGRVKGCLPILTVCVLL